MRETSRRAAGDQTAGRSRGRKWTDIVVSSVTRTRKLGSESLETGCHGAVELQLSQKEISFRCTAQKVFREEIGTVMFAQYRSYSKRPRVSQCSVWALLP